MSIYLHQSLKQLNPQCSQGIFKNIFSLRRHVLVVLSLCFVLVDLQKMVKVGTFLHNIKTNLYTGVGVGRGGVVAVYPLSSDCSSPFLHSCFNNFYMFLIFLATI